MQASPRRIELLAPAKDIETARAAIQHGADAVYMGAPRFGARASAGVSLEDIRQICAEAHIYGVRVYVTLNTIIYDHELEDVRLMIWDLYHAGADAIIIQDMGITMMDLPPIPLHSSTQCDTTEPEDAMQLEALGFEQIVLARELNVEQIRRIKSVTTKPLEVFVHGALCVSYSGRCYISEAFTDRSANRGECSQQCRMTYDLCDSQGTIIRRGEHLLSPKDLNRSELLEQLLDAGASSLKIEGRLKSVSYVKNITAHYRKCLDAIIAKYPERYERASYGRTILKFDPNPAKSFNRGFTDYQFHMPSPEKPKTKVVNIHSPKSQGEYLGLVQHSNAKQWQIATKEELSNGDGLLYITPQGEVSGIKVNTTQGGGKLSPARPLAIPKGSKVYRNYDSAWERMLSSPTAQRRLAIRAKLTASDSYLRLALQSIDRPSHHYTAEQALALEPAKSFAPERIKSELSKMGDTIFELVEAELDFGGQEYFVPMSILSTLRRTCAEGLYEAIASSVCPDRSELSPQMKALDRSLLPHRPHFVPDYRANIANALARQHYHALGYGELAPAYELDHSQSVYLMTTKHCIKHELGYCTRETKSKLPYNEPLYLLQGGRKIRLDFDCHRCQMYLLKD